MVARRSHNPKVVSSILTRRIPARMQLATLKVGQGSEAEAGIEPTRVDNLGTASRRPNRPPTTPPRKLGEARGKREPRGDGEAGIEPTRADPSALQAAVSTARTHTHPEIGRGEGQAGIGPTRAANNNACCCTDDHWHCVSLVLSRRNLRRGSRNLWASWSALSSASASDLLTSEIMPRPGIEPGTFRSSV